MREEENATPLEQSTPVVSEDELTKARELKEKTDAELISAKVSLESALQAIPENAAKVFDAAREEIESSLSLVIAEISSRAKTEEENTKEDVIEEESKAKSWLSLYGSKINETAKWIVLLAIVYRLFIF
jgi:vacuolar-type H+-ATPase subunit E/Vma4